VFCDSVRLERLGQNGGPAKKTKPPPEIPDLFATEPSEEENIVEPEPTATASSILVTVTRIGSAASFQWPHSPPALRQGVALPLSGHCISMAATMTGGMKVREGTKLLTSD
jgi:hypothetical protein